MKGVDPMKRVFALLTALILLSVSALALAERRVDENGAYTYDYDKTPYDAIIFGNRTYGEFLQGHGNSSYDFQRFLNSEFGEIYAKYAALAVQYRDNMDEGLLAYWREAGMEKILVRPQDAADSSQDYYVYMPVNAAAEERFPLVIVNHGANANARVCESFGWIELAGEERFMLAMAENTQPEALYAMLQAIKADYPVDASRVYMTGTSQGGNYSKQFAGLYPDEVAAIAPMNISFSFLDGVDGDIEALREKGIPMLFVAGTADVYHPLPIRNNANALMGSVKGWNDLLALQGFTEYCISEDESAQLLETSMNLLESYTGLRLPEPIIHNYVNNRTFECRFTDPEGVTRLCLIIEENGSHEPLGEDAKFAWNFLKQFSR